MYVSVNRLEPHSQENAILHYTLAFLPAGYKLSLMPNEGILSLVGNNCNIQQHRLTERETYVLLALLECSPNYCPYEHILAAFRFFNVSPTKIEECRQEVLAAIENGNLDSVLADVRTLICRLRKPLQRFGLNIASITSTGYMLRPGPALSTFASQNAGSGAKRQLTPVPITSAPRAIPQIVMEGNTSPLIG